MAGSHGPAPAGRQAVDLREHAEEILRAASRAPSLHNAQPWSFRICRHDVEVYADASRRVPAADPVDRQLFIGIGAAVFGVRLALLHLGVDPVVRPAREPARPDLAAVVSAGGAAAAGDEADLHRYLERRRTVRTPFTDDAVPVPLQVRLTVAARDEWVAPHWLVHPDERSALAALAADAERRQQADLRFRAELAHWTGTAPAGTGTGIPPANVRGSAGAAGRTAAFALREFAGGPDGTAEPEAHPGILVLGTPTDRRADWLRTGQALHHVLLAATRAGFAASYVNQPLEMPDLRLRVREALHLPDHPQLILRIGRPAGELPPPTPRRPLADLLRAE